MRNLFDSWKYIFKNIWFLLPFAVVPVVFLALSLDYSEIHRLMTGFFTGAPRMGFEEYFRVWSFIRIDSWLGGIYSFLAFVSVAVFTALMLSFVEKHLRIGKRSLSGIYGGFVSVIFSSFVFTLAYTVLYELWALLLSALLFLIASIPVTPLVYVFFVAAFLLFTLALLYVATVFYLWFPCRQMTGLGFYNAFLCSYRLMTPVRRKLVLSYLISVVCAFLVIGAASLLPEFGFRLIAVVVFCLLYLSFTVRMETCYFEADKLDREDILHSYKEY